MSELLSIRETANICGVHIKTVREWETKGYLFPVQRESGGHRKYNRSDVEEWHVKYSALEDLTDKVFYPWYVVGRHPSNQKIWFVKCEVCGIEGMKNKYETIRSKGCRNCSLLPKGYAGLNNLLVTYKNNAKKNKRDFCLTADQFKEITGSICYYCGSPPAKVFTCNKAYSGKKSTWGDYVFNGIDRLDNSIGYTQQNCVSCCYVCNRGKNNMSSTQFIEYISNIKKNSQDDTIPCLNNKVDS